MDAGLITTAAILATGTVFMIDVYRSNWKTYRDGTWHDYMALQYIRLITGEHVIALGVRRRMMSDGTSQYRKRTADEQETDNLKSHW